MQGSPRQSYYYTRQRSSGTCPWAAIASVSLTNFMFSCEDKGISNLGTVLVKDALSTFVFTLV